MVRFFKVTIAIGCGLVRNLIGNARSAHCLALYRSTESGSTVRKRPVASILSATSNPDKKLRQVEFTSKVVHAPGVMPRIGPVGMSLAFSAPPAPNINAGVWPALA